MLLEAIHELSQKSRVFDLSLPLFQGMPSGPAQSPFLFSLTKLHGDVVYRDGASSANDLFSMGSHVGTHIDALGHVSRNGVIAGGSRISDFQSLSGGLKEGGIERTAPIVTRGVLLDVARLRDKSCLSGNDEISGADLRDAAQSEGIAVMAGDAVLVRTGWRINWLESKLYYSHPAPGVNVDGARWLVDQGVSFTGSDTPAYEKTPARGLAVHLALMVDATVQIIEMLDLELLAKERVYEFLFVALPLRIVGATGSPIRPIAIV